MRLVVSMTTSPSRIVHLDRVLESLYAQTVSPDAIYLNLPERYRSQEVYPTFAGDARVQVKLFKGSDPGPILKILPALELEADPDAMIVTVDDDVAYPVDMLATFVAAVKEHPSAAFGSKGFVFEGDRIRPLRGAAMAVDVVQGYGACAYRRGHFDVELLARTLEAQPAAFRFSDDMIISNHLAGQGVPRFSVCFSERLEHLPWGDEDRHALKFMGGGTHRRYLEMRGLRFKRTCK